MILFAARNCSCGQKPASRSPAQKTSPAPAINSPPSVKKILLHQPPVNPRSGSNTRRFVSNPSASATTQSRFFPYNARVNRACNIPLHWDEEPDLRHSAGASTYCSAPQASRRAPVALFRLMRALAATNDSLRSTGPWGRVNTQPSGFTRAPLSPHAGDDTSC